MCFFGGDEPPQDNSAAIARREEDERQARITAGQGAIDQNFAGFNDDFYNNYTNAYTDYYDPQLNDQHRRARERATLGLAGSGNLTSSEGARVLGDVSREFGRQRTNIRNQALGATNNRRTQVENARGDLYALNRASADPTAASNLAATRAATLVTPEAFTPLGDMFASLLNNAGNALAIEARGSGPGLRTGWFDNPTQPAFGQRGSSRTVN